MPHLLVDISSHGYGHVAQTAPVVNELTRLVPGLRVTVRSAAPHAFLGQRFSCEFRHIPEAMDFGMKMVSAVEVDVAQSMAAYVELHADWDERAGRAAENMQALKPDLLLANVPYLSLAAASAGAIPAVGMCCLNWADIYRHYSADDAVSNAIHAQMLAAYNSADLFLKVQPSIPMPDLRNTQGISPIARLGIGQRGAIAKKILTAATGRLVMVAMGGFEYRLPMENWPEIPGVHWLVPRAWDIARPDTTAFEALDMPFSDALASCDAVLTKPGYGTFAEAACSGVPVLYVSRGDWPEAPYLVQWLEQNGVCAEVHNEQLQRGALQDLLMDICARPKPPRPGAKGALEAARIIRERYF